MTHVEAGWLAVLVLWMVNGLVFSGVQVAPSRPTGHGEDDAAGGSVVGEADPVWLAEPVPVLPGDRR